MLKPINPISNRVAEGRKHASRAVVVSSLSSVSAFVFRREISPVKDGEGRYDTIYEGGLVLSDIDDHAVEYKEQGHAIVLFDHITGGSIHSDGDDTNIGEEVFYAQIEPIHFSDYGKRAQMLKNVPDWKPIKGDIFALVVSQDIIKWVEVLGISGQSLHSHYGERYVLNVRDRLMHLDPFKNHEEIMQPQANRFPLPLADLTYLDTPIYNVRLNDPNRMDDDEITTKVFKLVTFTDPQLVNYNAVIAVKHMAKATNSPYFFSEADQAKITANIDDGEVYLLSSNEPVQAIETSMGYFSNLLFMIDDADVVGKIAEALNYRRAVKVMLGEKIAYEILPTNFDEVRKAYHFILSVQLGGIQEYTLMIADQFEYALTINTTALQVADE